MKKLVSLLCCLTFSISGIFSQEKSAAKTDSIKVSGNCGMCKSTMESALKKKDGILSKNWNKTTKTMKVTYDPSKITIQKIGEKIASVGYDNQYAIAPDAAYKNLHECCQYDRPKK